MTATTPTALLASALAAALLTGCTLPGHPPVGRPEVPTPQSITSFTVLYGKNCAACHGADGQNGAAVNLANPLYQAMVDDATLHDYTANGEKGTLMPAFSTAAGGMLTPAQVDSIVLGMRKQWYKGNVLAGQNPPPYRATHPGNPAAGQAVYDAACARCHGPNKQHPGPAGSILDGTFLALINGQTIRTTILAGRPDIGQPDWRNDIPGRPLTDNEITDVTAWMVAQRPVEPGQPYPPEFPTAEKPSEAQPTNIQKFRPYQPSRR